MSPVVLLIIFLYPAAKIQCKDEKIKFFLTDYEIVKPVHVERRLKSSLVMDDEAEKSLQLKAFGKTFILDLSFYFPREDSELSYISKLKNVSDSFLGADYYLHNGFVRDVKDSFVIGFCHGDLYFRGYVFTDEAYAIEPYEEDFLIVYRFKDVIVPGCSKMMDGADLDCTETKYFKRWKANKPPVKKSSKLRYNLFYDKYFEYYNKLQSKMNASKVTEKDKSKEGTKEANNDKEYKDSQKKHDKGDKSSHEEHDKDDKDSHKEQKKKDEEGTKETNKEHKDNQKKHDKEDKTSHKEQKKKDEDKFQRKDNKINDSGFYWNMDEETYKFEKAVNNETKHSDESNKVDDFPKKKSKTEQDARKTKSRKKDDDDDDDVGTKGGRFSSSEYLKSEKKQIDFGNISSVDSFDIWNKLSLENNRNLKNEIENRSKGDDNFPVITEALEGEISDLQCNVEVVVGPSYRKKFQKSDEKVVKDIYTQFTLLNRIFRKVTLKRKGAPFRLTLNIEKIVLYTDEVYSPFTDEGDLEYFTKSHHQMRQFCLSIGLVNQLLRSGQFFDGYIPEAGGGVCSLSGNTLIVSHGNDNTPAPMALFFSALIRGVTRALGANDRDPQCDVGSYPNPMAVLKDYLLTKEIVPTEEYSIFTFCNIREIENALRTTGCLLRMSDPLCGNGVIEQDEECDCGPTIFCDRIDPCCTPPHLGVEKKKQGKDTGAPHTGCKLVKGAKCGMTQPCCSACNITMDKTVCYSGNGACDIAHCNGKSAKCPTGVEESNGLICSEYNETMVEPLLCKDMECNMPLCTGHGLKPCTCAPSTGRDCVYCCAKDGKCRAAGSELKLMEGRDFVLPDGMDCIGGTCLSGRCTSFYGKKHVLNFTNPEPPRFPVNTNSCCSLAALRFVVVSLLPFSILLLFSM